MSAGHQGVKLLVSSVVAIVMKRKKCSSVKSFKYFPLLNDIMSPGCMVRARARSHCVSHQRGLVCVPLARAHMAGTSTDRAVVRSSIRASQCSGWMRGVV